MKPGQQTSILYIPFTNKVQYGHAVCAPVIYATPRYLYDPIGNTTQDLVSGQDTIQWNLYNKVIRTVNNTDTSSMKFIYDGAGNRVGKMYIKKAATGARSQKDDYYVRDAQGNILAIYHLTESFGIHGALQQQAFSLAEHDIYGSSRLGIKEYYGLQVGGSIDFTTGTYDTMRLFNKPPWYSLEYQDDIRPDSVNLYGNAFKDMYFAQHILGQKQYELTDHLGDVLATVSDKRAGGTFAALGGGSLTAGSLATISTWKSEVISAHDYYPFGEYMPGRYMTDTTSNCVTTTITSITPAIYYDSVSWASLNAAGHIVSHPVGLLGSVNLTTLLGVLIETTTRNGSGISYTIPYVSANSTHIDVVVSGVIGGAFNFVVNDASGAFLGSATHSGLGVATISITGLPVPHSTSVTISVNGTTLLPDEVGLMYLIYPRDTTISHSIVTTVCNKDFYRYGFNGKLKDNEWAGLGNSYDYGFRMLDTRIGRFRSADPLTKKYPSLSAYQYASNRPIISKDIDGLEAEEFEDLREDIKAEEAREEALKLDYEEPKTPTEEEMIRMRDAIMKRSNAARVKREREANPMTPEGQARIARDKQYEANKPGLRNLFRRTFPGMKDPEELKEEEGVKDKGIIYKRTDPRTGEEYIGQSESPETYRIRQSAHNREGGVNYIYEVLESEVPKEKLNEREEAYIRNGGGPARKGGNLQNKRYQMSDNNYKKAGGTESKPTN